MLKNMFFLCLLPLPDNMLCLLLCLLCTRAKPHQLQLIFRAVAFALCLYIKNPPPQILFPAAVLAAISPAYTPPRSHPIPQTQRPR